MAVETILGTYIKTKIDSIQRGIVRPQNFFGRVRTMNDTAEFPAASSIGSTIAWGGIPLRAVLLGASRMSFDLLHPSGTLDFGFVDDSTKGISSKTAALISAQVTSAAASVSALAAVNIDKTGKRLWEILGLSSDPGGDGQLVTTLGGNAGTGTVSIDLLFAVD